MYDAIGQKLEVGDYVAHVVMYKGNDIALTVKKQIVAITEGTGEPGTFPYLSLCIGASHRWDRIDSNAVVKTEEQF